MKKILVILTVIASFVLCSCEPPTVNVPSNIPSNNIPSGNNENNPNNEPTTPSSSNGEDDDSSSSKLTIPGCCENLKNTNCFKSICASANVNVGEYPDASIHIVFKSKILGEFYKSIVDDFNKELTKFKIIVRYVDGKKVDSFNIGDKFTNIDVAVDFN